MSIDAAEIAEGQPSRGPRLRDYLAYLTLPRLGKLAYGIVVSVVLGELAIAVVSPRQDVLPDEIVVRDPVLGFRMVPGFRGVEPSTGIPLELNSDGLRERDLGPPRADSLRVYVLGDSVVFGLGVSAEAAFPRALERVLSKDLGRPVEVVNGGVPGYGTMQELALFEETVGRLKPDVVLATVSVFNDVTDNLKFAVPEKRWQNTPKAIYRPIRWLRENSQLYLLTRRYRSGVSAEKMMDIHAVNPTATTRRGLELTEASLSGFARAAAAQGAAFAVVVAPAQKQASDALWTETLRSHGLDPDAYAYDLPNRRLAEYADRRGIPLLDLLGAMRSAKDVYENEHWSPEGHQMVAEAIAVFLRQKQLIQTRAGIDGVARR